VLLPPGPRDQTPWSRSGKSRRSRQCAHVSVRPDGTANLVCGRMERLEREAEGHAAPTVYLAAGPAIPTAAMWQPVVNGPPCLSVHSVGFLGKMQTRKKRGFGGISYPLPEMTTTNIQNAGVGMCLVGGLAPMCSHPVLENDDDHKRRKYCTSCPQGGPVETTTYHPHAIQIMAWRERGCMCRYLILPHHHTHTPSPPMWMQDVKTTIPIGRVRWKFGDGGNGKKEKWLTGLSRAVVSAWLTGGLGWTHFQTR